MATPDEIELLERIDAAAERFEDSLKRNSGDELESYLQHFAGEERLACFRELLSLDVDYRLRRNLPVEADEYKGRFPNWAGVIKEIIGDALRRRPRRIGPYELREKLGQGGMGTVYKAWHSRLRRYVAMKMLPPETANDEGRLARFDREMQAVGKLSHPNVVAASDADCRDGVHFLAMDYCDGKDIGEISYQLGAIDVANACEIICQAAAGLQHAHEYGLVHRDIKPSNLMLTRDGVVRILDMGLARLNNSNAHELTSSGQVVGTIDYMAPEQAATGTSVGIGADIYSLGMTLFKLLTGTLPFSDPKYDTPIRKLLARTSTPAASVAEFREGIPAEVVDACDRMLLINPDQRFQEPREIAEVLKPFCADADLVNLMWEATRASTANPGLNFPDMSTAAQTPAVGRYTASPGGGQKTQLETQQRNRGQRPAAAAASPSTLVTWKYVVAGSIGLCLASLLGLWSAGLLTFETKDTELALHNNVDELTAPADKAEVTIENNSSSDNQAIEETPVIATEKVDEISNEKMEVEENDSVETVVAVNESQMPDEVPEAKEPITGWQAKPGLVEPIAKPDLVGPRTKPESVEPMDSELPVARQLVAKGAELNMVGPSQVYCKSVDDLPEQDGRWRVQSITLAGREFADTDLESVALLQQLERFEMRATRITGDGLHSLASSPIASMLVGDQSIREQFFKVIGTYKKLVRLELDGCYFEGRSLGRISDAKKLKELRLSRVELAPTDLMHLESLALDGLVLEKVGLDDTAIAYLSALGPLESLELNSNDFTPSGIQRLNQKLPLSVRLSVDGRASQQRIARQILSGGGKVATRNPEAVCERLDQLPKGEGWSVYSVVLPAGYQSAELQLLVHLPGLQHVTYIQPARIDPEVVEAFNQQRASRPEVSFHLGDSSSMPVPAAAVPFP